MPSMLLNPNTVNAPEFVRRIRDEVKKLEPNKWLDDLCEGFTKLSMAAEKNPTDLLKFEEAARCLISAFLHSLSGVVLGGWLSHQEEDRKDQEHLLTDDNFMIRWSSGLVSEKEYKKMIHHLVRCRNCCGTLAEKIRTKTWSLPAPPAT